MNSTFSARVAIWLLIASDNYFVLNAASSQTRASRLQVATNRDVVIYMLDGRYYGLSNVAYEDRWPTYHAGLRDILYATSAQMGLLNGICPRDKSAHMAYCILGIRPAWWRSKRINIVSVQINLTRDTDTLVACYDTSRGRPYIRWKCHATRGLHSRSRHKGTIVHIFEHVGHVRAERRMVFVGKYIWRWENP